MLRRVLFPLLGLFLSSNLHAEIQKVVLSWNNELCREACQRSIQKAFEQRPEVAQAITLPGQSSVILRWKPNKRFQFRPLDYTLRSQGLSSSKANPPFLQLRGTIAHSGKKVYIVSIGDNTRFELLSPPDAQSSGYISRGNINTFPLREEARKILLDAERKHYVVTIAGHLFSPQRSPLRLIAKQITVHRLETNAARTFKGPNLPLQPPPKSFLQNSQKAKTPRGSQGTY